MKFSTLSSQHCYRAIRAYLCTAIAILSSGVVQAADLQIAALTYIKNIANKRENIFNSNLNLTDIKKRMQETAAYFDSSFKTSGDTEIKKAYDTIYANISTLVGQLSYFYDNNNDIEDLNTRIRLISTIKENLRTEQDQNSALVKLQKRRFPLVSAHKKELIKVLLEFANTYQLVAQKAIPDFTAMQAANALNESPGVRFTPGKKVWQKGVTPNNTMRAWPTK